jgi:GDPmannose 4,6-dehydratase
MKQKIALITGVNGQDGSYLTELLLSKGYKVIGLKRRTSTINTSRIDKHLANPNFILRYYDLLDSSTTYNLLYEYLPDEIYNLGAQSHVKVSYELPKYTIDTIVSGTLNWLEAIKLLKPDTRFYQASSSEMFGDNPDVPINGYTEDSKFMPVSPYAAAKVCAHNLVQIYRKSYNLHASCGILFNHESPLRGETFVTRKITIAAAKIKTNKQKTLHLGNLLSKRDWGFTGDYVEAMWKMLQQDTPDDYIIATGKTYTVEDFLTEVFNYAELGDYKQYVHIDEKLYRPLEVPYLLGDSSKAKNKLQWTPTVDMKTLSHMMYDYDFSLVNKL